MPNLEGGCLRENVRLRQASRWSRVSAIVSAISDANTDGHARHHRRPAERLMQTLAASLIVDGRNFNERMATCG